MYIRVFLKYTDTNESVINGLKRYSKPGLRVYVGKNNIPRLYNGLGVSVVSTSHGVLTGKKAREKGVGGEIVCQIW
jgi:small subunit ribosomal protein S8